MSVKILFSLLLPLSIIFSVKAQHCSAVYDPSDEPDNLAYARIEQIGDTFHFPLSIHIISSTSATSASLTKEINYFQVALDSLNKKFKNLAVIFFICGKIEYIKDDKLHNFQATEQSDAKLASHDVKGTLNIYISDSLTKNGSITCGFTFIGVSEGKRRMYLSKYCLDLWYILSHEMGHAFNLFHTFESQHHPKEFVSRNDCMNTGDLICDTPADPGLRKYVDSNCVYNGNDFNIRDDDGKFFNPLTDNLMSYYSCARNFTPGQYSRMNTWFFNNKSSFSCPDLQKEPELTIYPNPGSGNFTFKTDIIKYNIKNATVKICNDKGQIVFSEDVLLPAERTIDLEHLSSGLYIVYLFYTHYDYSKVLSKVFVKI